MLIQLFWVFHYRKQAGCQCASLFRELPKLTAADADRGEFGQHIERTHGDQKENDQADKQHHLAHRRLWQMALSARRVAGSSADVST
jgi:hypothetical protein